MFARQTLIYGLGAVLGGVLLASGPTPASAASAPVPGGIAVAAERVGVVDHVQSPRWDRRDRRAHRYDRGRHGERYRSRRPGYTHYHDGYWYRVPWWAGVVIAPQVVPQRPGPRPAAGGRAHVEWCLNRYRSYNPRTDTFRGYDGRDHRCRSPYS